MWKEHDMTIKIRKLGDGLYEGKLEIPDMPAVKENWSTPEPMSVDRLAHELSSRGAHMVDVCDAFDEADRNWPEDRRRWPDEWRPMQPNPGDKYEAPPGWKP
jgi:hypothetical protein